MRALHVVGVDLQLRLAVHASLTRHADVAIRLVSLCLVGAVADEDATGKGAHGAVIEDVLEELVAGAAGHTVRDVRVCVHALLAVFDGHTAEGQLGAFAIDASAVVVARLAVVERDTVNEHVASSLLCDEE